MLIKKCLYCQKPYSFYPYEIKVSKYCSNNCRNIHVGIRHSQKIRTDNRPTKVCLLCNKKYKVVKNRIKVAKFCSKKCYGINQAKFYAGKRKKIICSECNKTFYKKPSFKGNYCSMKCRSKGVVKQLGHSFYQNIGILSTVKQGQFNGPTSIEKKLYEELKERGFLFEKQKLINGKFLVDAYIPSFNLIIEADGDYWHSLDKMVKKDKAENAYLTKCGYKLLRLSETNINNGSFKQQIICH